MLYVHTDRSVSEVCDKQIDRTLDFSIRMCKNVNRKRDRFSRNKLCVTYVHNITSGEKKDFETASEVFPLGVSLPV